MQKGCAGAGNLSPKVVADGSERGRSPKVLGKVKSSRRAVRCYKKALN